ncbi:Fructokinase [Pediococcus damnosus]|uniref:ROK family protein n=1 Tax=Pediococcus damnosus TaxID=51663 RepID=UPI00078CC904|nr:ROK family protein [Pediococcus damnosus]AMV70157.1 Fructokinase [Pediococcus damnosus]
MYYGGIEAGGTKFVCAVSDEHQQIIARTKFATTTPNETIIKINTFFSEYSVVRMAVGAFGPIGINPDSQDYGYVKETPKKGWQHFNFLGELKKIFHIPIVWTTDVNVATYGEYKMGAATNKSSALYLTVGTGIGGGFIYKNNVFQNWNHPEMGHIMVSPMHKDKYTGNCPYHKSCLEGMASGPALEARANQKALAIPKDDPLWNLEAFYLAQAAMTYTLLYAPEIIIFGGGVSNQEQLYPLIRKSFSKQLNHYVDTPKLNKYLVHAKLGDDAGITGALLLAQNK